MIPIKDAEGRYLRLTTPLVREGGALRPATWAEALDRAAAGFRRAIDARGPDAAGIFSCSRATNEVNYLAQKLARVVFGTNNVDSCNRTCHAPSVVGLSMVFGAGGSTSSYREVEETDVILLWGGNPREAHPVWFQHALRGVDNGARLIVVDPRRTESAHFADLWLGLDVGTDIALANAMGREIIAAGLTDPGFIARATTGFDAYREAVEPYTLDHAERVTGVPAAAIREAAHAYARAERAMICWTLGITEHHDATSNVLSLINLALLTGHVGRWGSGLNALRGQNNVQGGGDSGALPNRLPGFQDVTDPALRAPFDRAWGVTVPPKAGWNLTEMLRAMERGDLTALLCVGENPAQSDADGHRVGRLLRGLDHLVVQDIFLTRTAQLADVVLPASASWCEAEGTVTNAERRVQRVRKAVEPPGDARDDLWILAELARRLGHDWGEGTPRAEAIWDELRSLAPNFAGMTYARLEALGGIQWPCRDEADPGTPFLHGRLWAEPRGGPPAPFSVVREAGPFEKPDDEFPFLLTTGRRLDSYNTGVQSSGFRSPRRRGETVDLAPEDAARLGVRDGDAVRVTSRRGSVVAPARVEPGMRPGLVFMSFHFPDAVDTNLLTIDAADPRSGTAEFKACAVRVEPAPAPAAVAATEERWS